MKIAILINDPMRAALKQTICLFDENEGKGKFEFVENAYEAHIIIAENAKDLIPFYCKEREFIIFSNSLRNDQEAKNVHEYGISQAIDVMTFPAIHAQKDLPEVLPGPAKVLSNRRIKNEEAKHVLVIDDTFKHQCSAIELLSEFDLTIATGYDEAMELLGKENFDVVLTDMEMPMSSRGAIATHVLGKLIPYGLLIEKEASLRGIKQIAVVTDLNHHTDPFACAFDYFSQYDFEINGSHVKYMHAPMIKIGEEYVKDWRKALNCLTGE